MKQTKKLFFRIPLLSIGLLIYSFFIVSGNTAQAQSDAQSYKYLRLTIDKAASGIHIDQIRWKMGDKTFPVSDLISFEVGNAGFSENEEVILTAPANYVQPAYKVFEKGPFSTYISEGAVFTLEFKNEPVYVTGVVVSVKWSGPEVFSCQGSNDNVNWDDLYTSPELGWSDYAGAGRDYVADFDLIIPEGIDDDAPTIPADLQVAVDNLKADVDWMISQDDGVGMLFYEIYVNDSLWQTADSNKATVYNLVKETTYKVQVRAVDYYGNRSLLSNEATFTTGTYPMAIRKMNVGIGMGIPDLGSGVYKPSPNFGGDWKSVDVAEGPFTQAFIDDMKHFNHIRFMNAFGANQSAIVNWQDRIQANDPNQIISYHNDNEIINKDILSYEWAIYLCNVSNADMWLNVPGDANEDYIRQLAALIKDNLNPGLNVYLENGNETWSGAFHVFHNYAAQGLALGLDTSEYTASLKYTVYKTIRVFTWFNDVFEDDSRVVKILSGQIVNTYLSGVHAAALKDPFINPDNIKPDFYAFNGYFNVSDIEGDGFKKMKQNIDDILVGKLKEQYEIWNTEEIKLVTFEGGIHDSRPKRDTYSRDKGIYDAYLYYLDKMAYFYDEFTLFNYIGPNLSSNNFGMVQYSEQSILETPKLRASIDWIDVNENNTAGEDMPPIILQQVEDVTVANGVTDVTFSISALEPIQSYQWFKNGTPIDGAIETKYTTGEIGLSNDGTQYYVEAVNDFGSTASNIATLTVTDHHLDIVMTNTAPVIDGNVDAMWSEIASQNIEHIINDATVDGDEDFSGNFKVTWDAEYIYFLVTVVDDILVKDVEGTDPKYFNYDGIEFYINGNNAFTNLYDADDAQFSYNWEGDVHALAGGKTTDGILSGQTNIDNGYIMEVALPWSTFGVTAVENKFIGMDVMLFDNDILGSNVTTEKKAWHSFINESWRDPRNMASVQLVSASEEEPETSYRYLKLTFTDYHNFKALDVDWLKEDGAVPATALTSNSSEGIVVSGHASNYKMYDDAYNSKNGVWIGTGTTPKSVTIDLGANPEIPNAIKIHKFSWAKLNGFKAEGSNDNVSWNLLVENTSAEEEFTTSTVEKNVEEAIFEFTTTSQAPSIIVQPESAAVDAGDDAVFSVTTSGSNLTYQWFKDNEVIENATGSTLTISSIDEFDAGDYYVVVSNFSGAVTSDVATLYLGAVEESAYRYLKITFTDYKNFKALDVDWLTASGSVPASALTSNDSEDVVVSGHRTNYLLFDDSYTSKTGVWIGNGNTSKSYTIDLGKNPAIANAIKIYKWSWAKLNGFKAEGSNDEITWDLLIEKSNANEDFNISTDVSGVYEATFKFDLIGNAVISPPDGSDNALEHVTVYPNPIVEGTLNIDVQNVEGDIFGTLTNIITREVVWRGNGKSHNNTLRLDVSRLKPGLYVLELRNKDSTRQYRVVKR